MVISKRYHVLYIAVPKTGSTSIDRAFHRQRGLLDRLGGRLGWPKPSIQVLTGNEKHIPHRLLENKLGIRASEFRSFGFTRNPWDQLVAKYHQLQKPPPENAKTPRRLRNYEAANKSFEDFVEVFLENPHSPLEYFVDSQGNLAVDYIGFFERLEEDFQEILRTLDMPAFPLPKINSRKEKRPYQEYYTPRLRKQLDPHFQKDCDLFGYDFERAFPAIGQVMNSHTVQDF